jgi:hypothetical protein
MELSAKVDNYEKKEDTSSFYEWNSNYDDVVRDDLDDDKRKNKSSRNNSKELKESLTDKIRQCRSYQRCVSIRAVFMVVIFTHAYHMYCIHDNKLFFLLCGSFLVIVVDGVYVFCKRKGRDYYW